jgi:hypothetical protein
MSSSVRQMEPAFAWRESERRAYPTAVVGFLVCGASQQFGLALGLQEPWQAGLCGFVGFYFAHLVLSLAYYYDSWPKGVPGAVGLLAVPFLAGRLWLRFSDRSILLPLGGIALSSYVASFLIHLRASGQPIEAFFSQLLRADSSQYPFESRRTALAFWATMVVGAIGIAWLLYLGRRVPR